MKRRVIFAAIVVLAAVATVFAQRGTQRREAGSGSYTGNVRYDGRFVFVRLSYPFSGRSQGLGDMGPPWSHDYPTGEYHFMKIMQALTGVPVHIDESSIMAFNDPELFKFPVAYLCEPGYWYLSEPEAVALRAYLSKGGFLIVDDFPVRSRGTDSWGQFEMQMGRVFPQLQWIRLDSTHPIFHSFFEINDISKIPTAYNLGSGPEFWALFEDNNPKKRMLVVANYMNDLSEFWQFSETGRYVVQESNEAYKFGVNEFVYGLTH
jgi:hypothetical protein